MFLFLLFLYSIKIYYIHIAPTYGTMSNGHYHPLNDDDPRMGTTDGPETQMRLDVCIFFYFFSSTKSSLIVRTTIMTTKGHHHLPLWNGVSRHIVSSPRHPPKGNCSPRCGLSVSWNLFVFICIMFVFQKPCGSVADGRDFYVIVSFENNVLESRIEECDIQFFFRYKFKNGNKSAKRRKEIC